jgi:hypothetical protein
MSKKHSYRLHAMEMPILFVRGSKGLLDCFSEACLYYCETGFLVGVNEVLDEAVVSIRMLGEYRRFVVLEYVHSDLQIASE